MIQRLLKEFQHNPTRSLEARIAIDSIIVMALVGIVGAIIWGSLSA